MRQAERVRAGDEAAAVVVEAAQAVAADVVAKAPVACFRASAIGAGTVQLITGTSP